MMPSSSSLFNKRDDQCPDFSPHAPLTVAASAAVAAEASMAIASLFSIIEFPAHERGACYGQREVDAPRKEC
jgi:hypothetical protein